MRDDLDELFAAWSEAARAEGTTVGERIGDYCAHLSSEKGDADLRLVDLAARFREARDDEPLVRSLLKEFEEYCEWFARLKS